MQGGVRKYITRPPNLPCSRADAHAHKKWQYTVAEGEEYRRDKRVCVQVRLLLSVMIFFLSGRVGGGGGGAVLTIKQIDGGDLKERRVGFFKKSYYSLKRLLISWKLLRLLSCLFTRLASLGSAIQF